jgi:hypothetical protein
VDNGAEVHIVDSRNKFLRSPVGKTIKGDYGNPKSSNGTICLQLGGGPLKKPTVYSMLPTSEDPSISSTEECGFTTRKPSRAVHLSSLHSPTRGRIVTIRSETLPSSNIPRHEGRRPVLTRDYRSTRQLVLGIAA